MEHEKLTFRVGHDHGGTGCRMSQDLDHRVDEGGRFTTTGGTDDQTVHRGCQVNIDFFFLIIVYGANRNTVLLLAAKLGIFIWLKQLVALLVRHEIGVFQSALDPSCLLVHHAAGTSCCIVVVNDPQKGDDAHSKKSHQISSRIKQEPGIKHGILSAEQSRKDSLKQLRDQDAKNDTAPKEQSHIEKHFSHCAFYFVIHRLISSPLFASSPLCPPQIPDAS